MFESLMLGLAFFAGIFLGAIFFGGLWWTIRRGLSSGRPALWFLGSLLVRMSVTMGGFYFVSSGRWQRMLLCLLGFIIARFVVVGLTSPSIQEARRAS